MTTRELLVQLLMDPKSSHAVTSWLVRVSRAGEVQTTTGFPTREAAKAWADLHVLPEDGLLEILEEGAAARRGRSTPVAAVEGSP
jgi:hypothetical protein